MTSKHWRLGLANQIMMSNSNLESCIFSRLKANCDIANNIAHQNDMISDIAKEVNILIKIDNLN